MTTGKRLPDEHSNCRLPLPSKLVNQSAPGVLLLQQKQLLSLSAFQFPDLHFQVIHAFARTVTSIISILHPIQRCSGSSASKHIALLLSKTWVYVCQEQMDRLYVLTITGKVFTPVRSNNSLDDLRLRYVTLLSLCAVLLTGNQHAHVFF